MAKIENPESRSAISARLRRLREAYGMKQTPWATRVGIGQQAWNNYENDVRRISHEAALLLCRSTGVSLDWIYRGISSGLPGELATKLAEKPKKPQESA